MRRGREEHISVGRGGGGKNIYRWGGAGMIPIHLRDEACALMMGLNIGVSGVRGQTTRLGL